jgi:hypothetical protein
MAMGQNCLPQSFNGTKHESSNLWSTSLILNKILLNFDRSLTTCGIGLIIHLQLTFKMLANGLGMSHPHNEISSPRLATNAQA